MELKKIIRLDSSPNVRVCQTVFSTLNVLYCVIELCSTIFKRLLQSKMFVYRDKCLFVAQMFFYTCSHIFNLKSNYINKPEVNWYHNE